MLVLYKPWRHLLPQLEPQVFAKTGTLTDVSTLAGYLGDDSQSRIFVLMVNEAVDRLFVQKVAAELAEK